MKPSILLAALCLLAAPAHAQSGATAVDGAWVGKGSVQLGPQLLACEEIRIRFVGTATLYGPRGASIACGAVRNTYEDSTDFAIDANDDIFLKGHRVGHAVADGLDILAPEMGETESEITLRRRGDLLLYLQAVRKPGQRPDYGVVAILKKDEAAPAPSR